MELPATVNPQDWENDLLTRLWEQTSHHVVENIFLPSAIKAENSAAFNTMIDIKLKQWADRMLPKIATNVAREILLEKFSHVLVPQKSSSQSKDIPTLDGKDPYGLNTNKNDPIFDLLREDVLTNAIKRHKWDEEYYKTLRVIQLNALEDRVVQNSHEWSEAIRFIEKNLGKRIQITENSLKDLLGPGWYERWTTWKYKTDDQKRNSAIAQALQVLLQNRNVIENPNQLSEEEVLTIRKSIEINNPKINLGTSHNEVHANIRAIWYQLYRRHFLVSSIKHCQGCSRRYYAYSRSASNQQSDILAASASVQFSFKNNSSIQNKIFEILTLVMTCR